MFLLKELHWTSVHYDTDMCQVFSRRETNNRFDYNLTKSYTILMHFKFTILNIEM